jgi:hypothetical protein
VAIDRRIYAPFTKLGMKPILGNGPTVYTGFLEESSQIKVKDITVGPSYDRRIVCSEIEIEALDADADFENETEFFKMMNQQVYVFFYGFGGGGFMDGPFRYYLKQEHLEGRGMRHVHVITGRTRWLPWLTFEDTTGNWQKFLEAAGLA